MITTFTDHQDCARCQDALENARVMAAVTGSVGCRHENNDTEVGGDLHRAGWYRDGRDPRPAMVAS